MATDFNALVNKAMGKVEEPEEEAPTKKPRSFVEYVVPDDGYSEELWPPKLQFRPVIGDMVESIGGKRLVITEVTHKLNEYEDPIVQLRLGRDKGDSSGTSGGGKLDEAGA